MLKILPIIYPIQDKENSINPKQNYTTSVTLFNRFINYIICYEHL